MHASIVRDPCARVGPTYIVGSMKSLHIDIWSDIACPWCYVGKRRLEAALERFAHRDEVEVRWRAFELDPSAPPVRDASVSYAQRIAAKYGMGVDKAQSMIDGMKETAAKDGLDFHFEKAQSGNTFDAHRLVHFATDRNKGDEAKERLFRAYMTEGQAVGRRDVLVRLAGEIGLPENEVAAMLASDALTEGVRADEARAQQLGIRGVPFFVVGTGAGRPYGVSGAQPADELLSVLERAWSELPEEAANDGAVCGTEGCA